MKAAKLRKVWIPNSVYMHVIAMMMAIIHRYIYKIKVAVTPAEE